ncbi:MAG: respiratory nitrate reductase subunit gamma, partial [Desulfomonilaceae bacterium]
IVPRVDMAKHVSILHKGLDCLACHSDAASFEHNLQRPVLCSNCHNPHDEATLHDAHSKVSCQDCHLTGIELSLDQQTKRIIWRRLPKSFDVSSLNITLPDHGTTSCHQCHKKGNHLGASVTVLPAKSVICMPCHAATFTVSDPITIASLIGFFLGMLAVVSVWFTGKTRTKNNKAGLFDRSDKPAFHVRLFTGLKVLFLDGLLQRRLFEHSHYRWFIHTLIFWSFMIRFVWGLTALIGSLVWPSNPWIWQMLNKNNPITAVLFDLTGVCILLGILLAILRKKMSRDESLVAGLPERDWLAVILLAAIVIVGFVLEGARIALTGETDINHFAFVGWALSLLWLGISGLSDIYGYVWYLHALLTGVFLIYLPFSGMLHLIMAPLAMALTFTDTNHPNH